MTWTDFLNKIVSHKPKKVFFKFLGKGPSFEKQVKALKLVREKKCVIFIFDTKKKDKSFPIYFNVKIIKINDYTFKLETQYGKVFIVFQA